MKIKIVALLAIFLHSYWLQNCVNGCLRCLDTKISNSDESTLDICVLCDYFNFFVKSGFTCHKRPIANCQHSLDGVSCIRCNDGYYRDEKNNKCVEITEEKLENCVSQKSLTECEVCDNLSFLSDGKCVTVNQQITGCQIYASQTTCEACEDGFMLNESGSCTQLSGLGSCKYYSGIISCTSCVEGYMYYKSKYLVDLLTNRRLLEDFYSYISMNTIMHQTIFQTRTNVCIRAIPNCLDVEDNNYAKCKTCKEGYYINNGICVKNPTEQIASCIIYSNATTCERCAEQHYLEDSACKMHARIINCKTYSQTTADYCDECNDGFKVEEGKCIIRESEIRFCEKLEPAGDICLQCQPGYIINPSGMECVARISRCKEHLFIPNDDDFTLLCKSCENGFYINTIVTGSSITTSCELPAVAIAGCDAYQTETRCIECRDGFYLANFQCQAHTTSITNNLSCKNKSTTVLNDCSGCEDDEFLYKAYNYCSPVTSQISNCEIYQDNLTCSKCSEGYYAQGSSCKITTVKDCIVVDSSSDKCLECDATKNLMPSNNIVNNKCIPILSYITNECVSYNMDITDGSVLCEACNDNFYPNNFQNPNYSFCVAESELKAYREQLTSSDVESLANCFSFRFSDKKCLYCDPASDKQVASGLEGKCVEACDSSEIIQTFVFKDFLPESFMTCVTLAGLNNMDNCKRIDYNLKDVGTVTVESDLDKRCVECHDSYVGLVNNLNSYPFVHYEHRPMAHFTGNPNNKVSYWSGRNKIPIFDRCVLFTNAIENNLVDFQGDYTGIISGISQNLDAYSVMSTNNKNILYNNCYAVKTVVKAVGDNTIDAIGCISCKFGLSGVVVVADNLEIIHLCRSFPECNPNVYYTGLGNHDDAAMLNLYVRCHQCVDANKIVTYTMNKVWSMPDNIEIGTPDNALNTKTGLLRSNECFDKGIISNNAAFPSNCAVQLIVTNRPFQVYTLDLTLQPNPICMACKPKYSPTVSDLNISNLTYRYIRECKLITNCKESSEFNVCQECGSGYVLLYDSGETNFTAGTLCVPNSVTGCLIGENQGKCSFCKEGYFLNSAGICDYVGLDDLCREYGSMTPFTNATDYLNTYPFGQGCHRCKTEMYSVRFNFTQQFCINMNALQNEEFGANFFIANCQSYSFNKDTGLICKVCVSGYFLTEDSKGCVTGERPNCLLYASDGSGNCRMCAETYYLQNGHCIVGQIKGCLTYNSPDNCITCAKGMVATRIKNNQFTVCFDVKDSIRSCLSFDSNEAYKGILKCNQCSNITFPIDFSLSVKTCAKFSSIDHCLEYDISNTFSSSSFFCIKCEEEYYLDDSGFPSKCRSRFNYPIPNCAEYETEDDSCVRCLPNYYISDDKLACVVYPTGIIGCRKYTSRTVCSECDENHYMVDGECVPIPDSRKNMNCFTFNRDLTCKLCKKGYDLSDGQCQRIGITRCLEVGFNSTCDECESGHVFFGKECEAVSVNGCLEFETASLCKKCDSSFFLTNGRCVEVSISIEQCVEYADNETCGKCGEGYILSTDKKKCIDVYDEYVEYYSPYCSSYTFETSCVVCNDGFYFDTDGECRACSAPNCRYCRPDNPELCILCNAGYHHNIKQECEKDLEPTLDQAIVDDPWLDFYIDASGLILKAFIGTVALYCFFD